MKRILGLYSLVSVAFFCTSVIAKPISVNGVFIYSARDRSDEICSCIKSRSTDCLYPDEENPIDQIILFGGDSIVVPPFELGCTVDVIGKGQLVGGKIDHYVGACLSPGGMANFSGYLMYDDDFKLSLVGIAGPPHIVWPRKISGKVSTGKNREEIGYLLDSDNGVYSSMLTVHECPGVSPSQMKKLFEIKY